MKRKTNKAPTREGWAALIGKSIKAMRGFVHKKQKNYPKEPVRLEFILFDDGETFISLNEQDYHTYHDCSVSARDLILNKDKVVWQRMFDCEGGHWAEPDDLGNFPF